MPLQRGEILGYHFNRMIVDFTMLNQSKTVRCAISTAAMDDLEGKHDVKADQRVDQFVRLRDAIEERASRKFFEGPHEPEGPVVFRRQRRRAKSSQGPQGRLADAVAELTRQSPEHPLMRRPALKLSSRAWRPPPGDETIDTWRRRRSISSSELSRVRGGRAARPAQEPRSDADVGPISPDYWRL